MKVFKTVLTAVGLIVLMAGYAQAQGQEPSPIQAQTEASTPAPAPLATAGQQDAHEKLSEEEKRARVIARLQQKAEQGDATAQMVLGMAYSAGSENFPADREKSLTWLTKAADQGSFVAKAALSMDGVVAWIGNPYASFYFSILFGALWLFVLYFLTRFMMRKDGVHETVFMFSKNTFVTGFRKYFSKSGRISRSGAWGFSFFGTLLGVAVTLLAALSSAPLLDTVWVLITFLPYLFMNIRRLHDSGRSGWWMLIFFTIIGAFVLLYWICFSRGNVGPNKYGPDPRGSNDGHAEAAVV